MIVSYNEDHGYDIEDMTKEQMLLIQDGLLYSRWILSKPEEGKVSLYTPEEKQRKLDAINRMLWKINEEL